MWGHVDAFAGRELRRSHMVEKHERADHAQACRRQNAPDGKPAEVPVARLDNFGD